MELWRGIGRAVARMALAGVLAGAGSGATPAAAQGAAGPVTLRYLCYGHTNECEVSRDLLDRFERDNPDIRVIVDKVSFTVIREQLELRLKAGQSPDMARVTNVGGLARFYLDLAPYVDQRYFEANFGTLLDWMRPTPQDRGIYGFPTQLTVSGPFVNVSMFRRAGVALPAEGATWDDWVAAVATVQKRLGVYAGLVIDRSGHRFAGPAISHGARFFDAEGRVRPADAGLRAFAEKLVAWHRDGVMPRDIWPAAAGARLRSGDDMFVNEDAVMHLGGSWLLARYAAITGFEWAAVPQPCGPAACSGMPGGAMMVAFAATRHPREVGRVMAFMASEPAMAEYFARTLQIPAHAGLAARGIDYGGVAPPAVVAALSVFTADLKKIDPAAHRLQALTANAIVFDAIAEHVAAAIDGRLTLDEAMTRLEETVERRFATPPR